MCQAPVVVDYCTKYEQNQHFLFRDITRNIKYIKNIAIITQIWHEAKYCFTCISNTWYLITVQNMNKSNVFFSEISQQAHKIYEKVAIITQI